MQSWPSGNGVMNVKLKEIQTLMANFENSQTREMKLDDGDFHLYLNKNEATRVAPTPAASAPAPETPTSTPSSAGQVKQVTSPLVGTVYLQPKPDAAPYVAVGSHITAGDVVCIIEAMKMMTEVKSDVTGTVTAINASDGELVEVEQPLVTITED